LIIIGHGVCVHYNPVQTGLIGGIMKSLKKSVIILLIALAGFFVIRAAEKPHNAVTGQCFTLEELGWQSAATLRKTTDVSNGGILSTADAIVPAICTGPFDSRSHQLLKVKQ
jgi:hypothetical protein